MAILKRAKISIAGLPEDLLAINAAIEAEELARKTATGTLTELTTTAKESLVLAINELVVSLGEADSDAEGALRAENNLSDLADVEASRSNLEVFSKEEVTSAINTAKLALGTNYNVADITARDALEDLDVSDRVFVADDGDGKWAMYVPADVELGTWTKIADQDSLENAISGPAIKAAYESQEDTNVFDDAAKARLASAILETAITQTIDAEDEEAAGKVVSSAAVSAYVEERIGAMADTAITKESLVVAGSTITLTTAPKNGVNGVLNFATVRYIDGDGVAYDAPVVATEVPEAFTISTDTVDQWDTFTVQVQYLHVVA